MNIVYYVAHAGGFVYEWHQYHIIHELSSAGHNIYPINPVKDLGGSASPSDYAEVLLKKIKILDQDRGIDVFFATAIDSTLIPSAIDEIRQMGIYTINLSCDDLSHPYRVKKVCSRFDINWSTVRENENLLKKYGANTMIMPWAANPHIFRPQNVDEQGHVGFIGAPYGARARHLAELVLKSIPTVIYGNSPSVLYSSTKINHPLIRAISGVGESWERLFKSMLFKSGRTCILGSLKRSLIETFSTPPEKKVNEDQFQYQPSPSFENMGLSFNQMALSLGSIELSSTYTLKKPLLFIRLREFEAAMCGGIHLVNKFAELQEYFEEDKEMLFYNDSQELIDKAKFYLKSKQHKLRQKIRIAARKRALADHTWLKRFEKIGSSAGLTFRPVSKHYKQESIVSS